MEDKDKYIKDGYLGPVDLISAEEAKSCYRSFFESIGQEQCSPTSTSEPMGGYHTRYDWAFRLATHPEILARIKSFLGNDILLWAMHFWYKPPKHSGWIPWHQDNTYWPMKPEINATAWVTLGETFPENGCLQVIAGSHMTAYPHDFIPGEASSFSKGISPECISSLGGPTILSMSSGQGVFFNESMIHGSEPNTSETPRVAFSLRYTTPEVCFDESTFSDAWKRDLRTVLVQGQDEYGNNPSMRWNPPSSWIR